MLLHTFQYIPGLRWALLYITTGSGPYLVLTTMHIRSLLPRRMAAAMRTPAKERTLVRLRAALLPFGSFYTYTHYRGGFYRLPR